MGWEVEVLFASVMAAHSCFPVSLIFMFFLGLGTALPPLRISQRECWDAFGQSAIWNELSGRSQALLRKVLLGDNGIATRHVAVDDLASAFIATPDALHARFSVQAPRLATEAARRALTRAGVAPDEIDAVVVSTCTGYLCPGLTSYVSEGLGLRSNALALDLVGQGCGAAVPNLRTADALLKSGCAGKVLSVCAEVCSAALYLDNDPGVLISACLFGDGAAAAVLSNHPGDSGRRVEWKSASTLLSPAERDQVRFEHKGGLLRNILTREVPALVGRDARRLLDEALSMAGLTQAEVNGWIFHSGGRDVLSALRLSLELTDHDLRYSTAILRDLGNMSSPSVLFALVAALADDAPGGWWWLSSFGAGFSSHGALLRVD